MTGRSDLRVVACCGGMVTYGGAERMVFAALEALREAGAQVHCILNDWAFRDIAVVVERVGATWSTSSYRELLNRRTRDPRQLAKMFSDLLRSHWDLLRVAWRFRPTHIVVSSHDVIMRNWLTLGLLRLAGVRVVMKMSNVPDPSAWHRALWRRWVNAVVSTFVCNSAFTRSELLACGIAADKAVLVYERLPRRDAGMIKSPRHPGRIVYVGQVIPAKGLHLLLDAVGLLVNRGLDVSLDVIGRIDGWEPPSFHGYQAEIRERASASDLVGRVQFLGWRDDVLQLMSGAEVHCCPSLPETRESFGLVVLEAKSVGVPSVVFDSGALGELVRHGVDGWVCGTATAEALAEGCQALLSNPARLRAAGEAAHQSAARFDAERFDREWQGLIGGSAA